MSTAGTTVARVLSPAHPRRRLRRAVPRVLLVANPRARRVSGGDPERLHGALSGAFAVTAVETEARGHATDLARAAADAGYDIVAVLGGDGTVSEVAHGLAGSETAVACLPAGTTDVFARSLGVSRDPTAAAQRLGARATRLVPRAVDLGTLNGRHFLCTAGVGLSASMTAQADVDPERKARFGQLHFTGAAISTLARRYLRNPPLMRVTAGGRIADGVTAMVQNSHALTYFGPREISVCDHAGLDTGTLSLALLSEARPSDVPSVVWRLISGRAVTAHPRVAGFAGLEDAVVEGVDGVALPVEADGEFLGELARVELGVAPGALRVVS